MIKSRNTEDIGAQITGLSKLYSEGEFLEILELSWYKEYLVFCGPSSTKIMSVAMLRVEYALTSGRTMKALTGLTRSA